METVLPVTVPETLQQAILFYGEPDRCLEIMVEVRWPNGVSCPHCASKAVTFMEARRVWQCKNKECRKQFSVKVGTLIEDSPIGLDKWLAALWMISNCKNGISSYEIHRALGITQKSAWFVLHRIRLALEKGSFEKLEGEVEADKTFIGGRAKNMHKAKREEKITGRGASGKEIVIGILERGDESKSSRVRAKVVKDTSGKTLQGEVKANVTEGTAVYTDAASFRVFPKSSSLSL